LPVRIDNDDPDFDEDNWFVLAKRLGEQVPVLADFFISVSMSEASWHQILLI
jgi:hypothetical protein